MRSSVDPACSRTCRPRSFAGVRGQRRSDMPRAACRDLVSKGWSACGQARACGLAAEELQRKCKVRLYAGFCAAGRPAVAIIRLGAHSRARSSHLPAASPSRIAGCLFGVAARRDCPFHPARCSDIGPTRLCCSDPHLTVDRCYLLRRSAQSGRSSRGTRPPAIARRTLRD
jgi:hypothetical protein